MDWKNYWDQHAEQTNVLRQVARTGYSDEKMHRLMEQQAAWIAEQLGLDNTSNLLDVCCGNGVFTAYLLPYCATTTGIDLSPKLIAQAKPGAKFTQGFFEADALHLDQWERYKANLGRFNAITLCFSFQYFETVEKGQKVIANLLPLLKSGGKLLLTDVPDRARFFNHYNTPGRIAGLVVQMAKGKNVMGKFWSEEELSHICKQLEVKGEKLTQPKHFPYAHYRMDYLITKP
jgi:2-polyprenyl-3-methyl-5-hydroxy-6-metoxy-1,4-benzoquinol methylase